MSGPDWKPDRRVVDRDARPLDMRPWQDGVCPLCHQRAVVLSRHHVVPKGQGGDDTPANLVWTCGDGTRGCHGVLTHRNRDGDSGLTFEQVASALVYYVRVHVPVVAAYCDHKKYAGWLERYYLGRDEAAA